MVKAAKAACTWLCHWKLTQFLYFLYPACDFSFYTLLHERWSAHSSPKISAFCWYNYSCAPESLSGSFNVFWFCKNMWFGPIWKVTVERNKKVPQLFQPAVESSAYQTCLATPFKWCMSGLVPMAYMHGHCKWITLCCTLPRQHALPINEKSWINVD